MIKTGDVFIETKKLGKLLLTGVSPYIKNDITVGYKYQVAASGLSLEKFSVKIEGEKLLNFNGDIAEVIFENLTVKPYVIDGIFGLTGTATGIRRGNNGKNN